MALAVFDEQRRLVYASAACGDWLQVDVQELIGRQAVYSSEPQSQPLVDAVAHLSPPPDVFDGVGSESCWVSPTGQRKLRFLPLPIDGQWGALVLVEPESAIALQTAPLSSRSDWHLALLQLRAQLPMGMQSEYLAGDSRPCDACASKCRLPFDHERERY